MKNISILITSIGGPPGKSAYESLKIEGFRKLYTCDSNKKCPQNIIQYKNFFLVPKVNDKNYFKKIKKIIRDNKIKILIPCIETEVIYWSKYKHKLKDILILVPPYSSLKIAVNKHSIYKLTKELNFPTLKTEYKIIKNSKIKTNLKYPFIVKPSFSWGMKNFFLIKNKNDLIKSKFDLNGNFIFQKYIRSNEQNIFAVGLLFNEKSQCVLKFCSKSLSTINKLGGAATSGIEVKNQKLIMKSIEIIKQIGTWHGPVMIEWIYNKNNKKFYLIDINPRLWGYSILPTFNGKNFALNIINILLKKKIKIKKMKKKYLFVRDNINIKKAIIKKSF